MRLAKYLAQAGVASRRRAEAMVRAGRVMVEGAVVTDPARAVTPGDEVAVDGAPVPEAPAPAVYALNKPAGVVSTASDPRGRPTVVGLIDSPARLYPVGRLDIDTTGLILLTNDGELAHRLTHPRYGVRKTYLADVQGPVPKDLGRRLIAGIELADGAASADRFRVVERAGSRALVEITVHEGRKRVVRRMLDEAGHPVSRLVRTDFGPVTLGGLRPGTTRKLTATEIGELYAAAGL